MEFINELELQNLRHLIGAHCTIEKKLRDYAQQCTDPAIINMLNRDADAALRSKETLMQFLS